MVPLRVSLAALLMTVCVALTIKAGWAFESLKLTSNQREILQKTNKGLEKFSMELFAKLSEKYPTRDFVFSPISIWSLLLLITEGAAGSSRKQLQTTLGIPNDEQTLRQAYQIIHNNLNINTSSVEIKTWQALFPSICMPIYCDFKELVEQSYRADIIPVDYTKPKEAAATINDEVRRATNGFFTDVLDPNNLNRTELVMLSTLYFKGQWKFAFDKALSQHEVPFYDKDYKNKITTVTMMKIRSPLGYLATREMKSYVVELPYGNDNRFSMLLLLPKPEATVSEVVRNITTIGISEVLSKLDRALRYLIKQKIKFELQLPKFTVSFHFTANAILESMGVKDVFLSGNLKNIQPLMSISNLQQNAKIIVNEEGAKPGARTSFDNTTNNPKVLIDKSFAYMIVDRETKSLLFCGQVMKPTYSP